VCTKKHATPRPSSYGPSTFERDVAALEAVVQGSPMLATTPMMCDNLCCRRSFAARCRSDLEGPLFRCSKCKVAVYCSAACAKACFASHKKGCGVLQELKLFRAGGGQATVRVVESCVMAERTLRLLNLGDEIASLDCSRKDSSATKVADFDAKLLLLPISTIFLLYQHTGVHRENEREKFDRGFTVFQCDLPVTTPPSAVDSSILRSLTVCALKYMYAEEDRLCDARYYQHGVGGAGSFNPFQIGLPYPPGMAAVQGGRVDEQSNLIDLGVWSGLFFSQMGPGNFSPFRWETNGPFCLPEMCRLDISLSKISVYRPAAMHECVLVLVPETTA